MMKIWWGDCPLKHQGSLYRQLGPLEFSLQRNSSDWRLRHRRGKDPESEAFQLDDSATAAVLDSGDWLRFQFTKSPDHIELQPLLADRPVITKTDSPISLAQGEKVTFFVTTIMRLAFKHKGEVLAEIPVFDLQDTWFGTHIQGELCYASTTLARTNFAELPVRPYRPVTPVTVVNQTDAVVRVDKIKLPLPNLGLYATQQGRLHTDGIRVVCEREGHAVDVSVERTRNELLARDIEVAKPRSPMGNWNILGKGLFLS